MSKAFVDKWVRMSAARRMLLMLTYLAKKENITIPIAELEQIEIGEGLIQSFVGDQLKLDYAPPDTKVFFLNQADAVERAPTSWTMDPSVPERLRDLIDQAGGPEAAARTVVSTLDDQEMARREAKSQAGTAAQRARELRNQPLPVQQPSHPPS